MMSKRIANKRVSESRQRNLKIKGILATSSPSEGNMEELVIKIAQHFKEKFKIKKLLAIVISN